MTFCLIASMIYCYAFTQGLKNSSYFFTACILKSNKFSNIKELLSIGFSLQVSFLLSLGENKIFNFVLFKSLKLKTKKYRKIYKTRLKKGKRVYGDFSPYYLKACCTSKHYRYHHKAKKYSKCFCKVLIVNS